MKAIAFLRTSTDRQTIDAQRKELIDFIINDGYTLNDIIIIDKQGASARKQDDEYVNMIEQIKTAIANDSTIDCVYCWAVDRLVRKRTTFYMLVDFLKERKVNLKIQNVGLSLLRNGQIDMGADMALSVMVTTAEWEMTNKEKRFERARKDMTEKGLFVGGNTVPYGYTVKDKRIIIDEAAAENVREVFQMYATGAYSMRDISREMQQRGVDALNERYVFALLKNVVYTGAADEKTTLKRKYPQIISKALFEQCRSIARDSNTKADKQRTHYYFGRKIIKCPCCGHNMTAGNNNNHVEYRCNHHYTHPEECGNTFSIGGEIIDGLLWDIAKEFEYTDMMEAGQQRREQMRKEIEIINQRIANASPMIEKYEKKKQRVVDSYIDGIIEKQTMNTKIKDIQSEIAEINANVIRWNEEKENIETIINTPSMSREYIMTLTRTINDEIGEKKMQQIVRKHIKAVYVNMIYNKDVKARTGKKYFTIDVELFNGDSLTFQYHIYRKNPLYKINENGDAVPVLYVPYLYRTNRGVYTLDSYNYYLQQGVIPQGENKTIENKIQAFLARLTAANAEYEYNNAAAIEAQEMAYLNASRTN